MMRLFRNPKFPFSVERFLLRVRTDKQIVVFRAHSTSRIVRYDLERRQK